MCQFGHDYDMNVGYCEEEGQQEEGEEDKVERNSEAYFAEAQELDSPPGDCESDGVDEHIGHGGEHDGVVEQGEVSVGGEAYFAEAQELDSSPGDCESDGVDENIGHGSEHDGVVEQGETQGSTAHQPPEPQEEQLE